MRKVLVALAALLGLTSHALAQEQCRYASGYGYGTITFREDGTARFDNGEKQVCAVLLGDQSGNTFTCEGAEQKFAFAAGTLFTDYEAILIFQDEAWYRQCFVPT